MLANATRYCDVCGREILKRQIANRIEQSLIPPGLDIGGLTVDGSGQVQIDICPDCRMVTGVSGEELID